MEVTQVGLITHIPREPQDIPEIRMKLLQLHSDELTQSSGVHPDEGRAGSAGAPAEPGVLGNRRVLQRR